MIKGILLLAILLFAMSALCYGEEAIESTLNQVQAVQAGVGSKGYRYLLAGEEYLQIDFVNPDRDFTFVLGDASNVNPYPEFQTPRETGLKFFTLDVHNNTDLTAGVVFRWRYTSASVDPASIEFLVARGISWWEFDIYSEVNEKTKIVSQSFPNSEILNGLHRIGIFGGSPVPVLEYEDPRYNSFSAIYTIEESQTTKVEYRLDRKQVLQFEFVSPSHEFMIAVNRTTTNPGANLATGLRGLYFFRAVLYSSHLPGAKGLKFGSVITLKYPDGLPDNVDPTSLRFMKFENGVWKSFTTESTISAYTKVANQPIDAQRDLAKLDLIFAIVAQEKLPAPFPIPSTLVDQSQTEPSDIEERSSAISIRVISLTILLAFVSMALLLL